MKKHAKKKLRELASHQRRIKLAKLRAKRHPSKGPSRQMRYIEYLERS